MTSCCGRAEQTRQLADATLRVHRERLTALGRQRPAAFICDRVAPWLDSVASGSLDICDEEVRRSAHLLSLEVRDELTLPGVLDEALRRPDLPGPPSRHHRRARPPRRRLSAPGPRPAAARPAAPTTTDG